MNMPLIEACVDSYASCRAAWLGGADRLELCAHLVIGGTTPSTALFRQVQRDIPVKTNVLIRPRFGDFLYSKEEQEQMCEEIRMYRELGANGVVIGALTPDGDLDIQSMRRMMDCAGGMDVTLHRAFDMTRDPMRTLEDAIQLGCKTILTSGQQKDALTGVELLRELYDRANGRIDIMAGCGVKKWNIQEIHDRAGLVVWAEIPFISVMNPAPGAHENCRSQMKELIVQNYNHPSICFWGISNEITIGGERPGLLDNLRDLNALAHEMDKTRMTTIAHVSMVPMENDMHHITDVLSYNHYFGWYGGELENNEQWLDKFHALHPDRPLGISEYGAEGIVSYHSDTPKCKDYTEEYQAVYHEHLAKVIDERPWLWATHVWNMFDFGCDARDEGGVKGRNNKGLMTLDRKIRKDAFYLYKAYWSDEEFVHLCSRRYAQRTGEETTVKVYSNLPKVALYVDGRLFAEQEGSKVFVFEHVPMSDGFTQISARAGACADAMSIEKVAEPNQAYIYVDPDDTGDDAGAANWFNVDDYKDVDTIVVREGYFSVKDKIGDIMKNEEAGNVLMQFMQATVKMKLKKSMLGMVKDMTLEGMAGMASSMGIGGKAGADPEQGKRMLITLNEMLNKIKK